MLIDTHAHLDFEDFDSDRSEVIARAADAGLTHIINPGIDIHTTRRAIELAETHDMILAAAGIHPNESANAAPDDMIGIARLADHPRVVAIGETGLDFYRDRAPRDIQVRLFREHLALARDLDLPVIIHFRNVGADGIELTGRDHFEGIRGVFHCYGGSVKFAREIIDMGFYVGFDGPLTYPKSDRMAVARDVPLERCLLETDAPFLTPQAYRGSRNESAYLGEIAHALAKAQDRTVEDVIDITGRNARTLFRLDGVTA